MLLVLSLVLSYFAISLPRTEAEAAPAGTQVIPIYMDGFYVLFPGDSAPFLKAGKLMVPIRPFAHAIGVGMTYDARGKYARVVSLGETITAIQAGNEIAVHEEDLPYSLGAAPEVRAGKLFVPAVPILNGLKGFQAEVNVNALNKPRLLLKDKKWGRPLSNLGPDMLTVPYPSSTTANYDPLFPLAIRQSLTEGSHELTLLLQNSSGFKIAARDVQLEMIAVDANGSPHVQRMSGIKQDELTKAAKLSITLPIPAKAEYVLFRSRIVRSDNGDPYLLDAAMLQKIADRVALQQDVFRNAQVALVSSVVEEGRIVLTLRNSLDPVQPVAEEVMLQIRNELFQRAGFEFPLDARSHETDDET